MIHKQQVKLLIALVILLSFSLVTVLSAQKLTQTVRGKIIDKDSRTSLPGANVVVLNTDPVLGASTDLNGEFRIEKVPVGRISLKITYIGYEDIMLSNILVTSGKEVVLDLNMQESLTSMDEIVIKADKDKSEIANEMALVSARGVTVEETKRYAGSLNDPARMVSGYAGVTGDASGNNFIVVRGNSPKGIQWRLEGIEIPNPNHFSDEGATGGPINALNSEMLANSEFYSGAFAPEYGNALSGVFDMRLRKGNNEEYEYSASIGILGTAATAEGPLAKNGRSSFLVNYRYSTLTLLSELGILDFDGIPKYQDLSFKVHLPTKSLGTFSIFGLGGKSNILTKEYDDEDEDKLLHQGDYQADMGVVGATQYLPLGSKTYLQNSVSFSKNGSGYLGHEPDSRQDLFMLDDAQLDKYSFKGASTLNHKFNARHNLQAGLIYTYHNFEFYSQYFDPVPNEYVINQNTKQDASHYQGFVSWKYRPWEDVTVVSGVHAQGTTLNNNTSIEPRASIRWQFHPRQALSAGWGIHGKMESLTNYYSIIEDGIGSTSTPNTELDFSKARHYVVGYENRLGANLFFKMEAYYQQLYNIPVEGNLNSSYSLLNQVEWFTDRRLVNEGTGENLGVELTLERYFSDSYFFMVTGSFYDSKYKGMDGVERDSRFNGNYAGNVLIGKEFELSTREGKKKVLGLNAKVSIMGARKFTPIDVQASMEQDKTVYLEDKAYSLKGDDVFLTNLSITYRIDRKKTSQELKLDVQNVTNNAARIEQYYNDVTNEVEYMDQLPLLPVLMYTIHF
ncbi:TonB-dependent receptor [Fulvivirga sp. 29W222]|uniref:TonB-dependent receptor n=1 Tax=Fulvivirga marina TaxID=2494733 RepID=A0A937KAH1_9BACT|nr:TonB-dependent receptor [Fulvivirga marina]MBL6445441.1 TonB-dependent receptor [Fulvivirga marina]